MQLKAAQAASHARPRHRAETAGDRGRPARLPQIFINLLSNAVKFTPARRLGDRLRARGTSHRVLLIVADTGIGIAEEDLPKARRPILPGAVPHTTAPTRAPASACRWCAASSACTAGR